MSARLLLNGKDVGFVDMESVKFEREIDDGIDDWGNISIPKTWQTTIKMDGVNEEALALLFGGVPRRYALGAIPMSAGTHKPPGPWFIDRDAPPRRTNPDCLITPVFHQQKETTMIEKKNFVTPPVKTAANTLAERHLGSLVTITLPSGAEITDTLEQVHADKGNVFLRLSNVPAEDSTFNILDRCFRLDPKSVVLVRRPKAVRKTAKR